jgi:hypothetical protein
MQDAERDREGFGVGTDQYITRHARFVESCAAFLEWQHGELAAWDRERKMCIVHRWQQVELALENLVDRSGAEVLRPESAPAIPTDLDAITLDELRVLLFQRALRRPDGTPDLTGQKGRDKRDITALSQPSEFGWDRSFDAPVFSGFSAATSASSCQDREG